MYPARYSEVIAVGASNSFGEMTKFTNYSEELDLTAPGTNIVSTNVWSWGGFGVCSGTSMATPHVTGAVAMMLALDSQLSAQEVASILKHTSEQGDLNLIGALKKVWKRAFRKARRIKGLKNKKKK
jgi:subtilisin family serine protease